MQGKKHIQPKMMYQVHINDLVPQDNIYRIISQVVDFQFLYKQTAKYYGKEGQESIDPVVFFKICLVGYLNNINSDRRLIAYCSNCLDVRLFIQYDLDEQLPWHSTISRTRQLYGEEVFLSLFQQILSLCIEKGMVRGKRQAIDSAYVKANASLDSLAEKQIIDDVSAYATELDQGSEYRIKANELTPEDKSKANVSPQKLKEVNKHHKWKQESYQDMPGHRKADKIEGFGNLIRPRYLSNHTHSSTTDPDARISVKPGKSRQMNYFAQVSTDDSHHVITAAGADFADKRDSECLEHLLKQVKQNLATNGMQLEQILADTSYSSGEALQYCQENNIDAYIPNFGLYKPEREGFNYNKDLDQYECIKAGGNQAILVFKGERVDSKGYTKKTYRSSESTCKNCPLRLQCCGASTKFKKIDDSIHKPFYDQMHLKMQSEYARKIYKKRGSTVEPVLGTMLNFLNLKRVNARGIKQANKHVMLSALCYNLKKYLKFISKKANARIRALREVLINNKNSENRLDLSQFKQSELYWLAF